MSNALRPDPLVRPATAPRAQSAHRQWIERHAQVHVSLAMGVFGLGLLY
jgi:hypothetical protein